MTAFLVFLIAYTLSQFYRSFLAVIAPELATEIGLSAADLGNISATWFWVFALSQFIVGIALDRLGPRRTVPAFMVAAVAGAFLLSRAQSAEACMLANGLIGLGCSPIYMGALYTFGRTQPASRFAYYSAILLGFGSLGNLLGATPLAKASEAIGWRPAFVVIAGVTALAALMVLAFVRDPPRAAPESGTDRAGPISGLVEILSIRALLPLLPITLVSYAVMLAERGLWIGPYFAEVHGLEPVPRGNAVLAMAVAMSLGPLIYGPIDRMVGWHKPVVIVGSLATAGLFLTLALIPGLTVGPATGLLAAIGAVGMTYTSLLAHARRYFPAHLLGRGITSINFLFFAGAGLLQPLSGRLVASMTQQGAAPAEIFSTLHLTFGLLLAGATFIYLFSREEH
ncbi:MAG: MFS transporter [Hyphomicrobiaceae bacterium]